MADAVGVPDASEDAPQWELKKENVAPMRKGVKDVAALNMSLRAQEGLGGGIDDAAKEERRRLWENIKTYDGGDPIEPWLRLISWTEKSFVGGKQQVELLPLLEQCTKEITDAHLDMYRDDLRYLRVWMKYAHACRDPSEIFNYLQHRNIGQNYSLYYEARAAFYEIKGYHTKAMDTYHEGISRLAQPRERLQSKLEEFQHRMHKRIMRNMKRGDCGDSPASQPAPERHALASVNTGLAPAALGGRDVAGGQSAGNAGTSNRNHLQVFEESPSAARGGDQYKVLWTNLGTQTSDRRENQQRPSTWNTFRFPQEQQQAARAGSALDIPMDPELMTDHGASPHSARAQIPATQALLNSAIGYDARVLLGHGGEERSFEEARAERWVARFGVPKPPADKAHVAPAVPAPRSADVTPEAAGKADATIHTREAYAEIMSMFNERLPCEDDDNVPKRKRKATLSSPEQADDGVDNAPVFEIASEERSAASPSFRVFEEEHREAVAIAQPEDRAAQNDESPASLFVYEDTVILNAGVADDGHDSDQENQNPASAAVRELPARSLSVAEADAVVLRPLSSPRMAALHVEIDDGPVEDGIDEDGNEVLVNPEDLLRTAADRANVQVVENSVDEPFDRWFDSMRNTMTADREQQSQPALDGMPMTMDGGNDSAAMTAEASLGTGDHEMQDDLPHEENDEDDDALIDPFDSDICAIVIENSDQCPLDIRKHEETDAAGAARTLLSRVEKSGQTQALLLGSEELAIEDMLGKGAFATVYRALVARTSEVGDRDWAGAQEDDSVTCMEVALKAQSMDAAVPAWELYIGQEVCRRLGSYSLSEYLVYHEMHSLGSAGADGLALLIGRCAYHGSLQQLLNKYLAAGTSMDEVVVMYYTMDLLRIVGALHSIGIQHGDIKPDNVMLRNDSSGWEEWAPGRSGTWQGKGVSLCDWGRAIDMRALGDGPFRPDALPDAFRTFAPGSEPDRQWSYAADAYGICGVVHCMLFGKYMTLEACDVDARGNKLYRPTEHMKRNHQIELWHNFFDLLLNPEPEEKLPPLQSLHDKFEAFLADDETRRRSIKKQLMKQNIMMNQ